MAPFVIVIIEPPAQPLPQRLAGVECVQVNVLVLEGPPEPLDKDVVLAAAPTVHADSHVIVFQHLGKGVAGKLSALVGIEDGRCTIAAQGLLESLDAKGAVQGVGYPPGQHLAAVPVHDRHQVHVSAGHGYKRDIGCPHLVGGIDGQTP